MFNQHHEIFLCTLNTTEVVSDLCIKFHCFNSTAILWQLGCILITFFLYYMQRPTKAWLSEYKKMCKNHCKCFYIRPNANANPPTYNEVCEKGLPSYTQAASLL